PPPQALEVAQDRFHEKELFRRLGIPTPNYAPIESRQEFSIALSQGIGYPAVLKTRRLGYDGKGQQVLREAGDAERAWSELAGVPLLLEAFVPFQRELSLLAVRGRGGEVACYPLVQNHHRGGILYSSRAPAPGAAELQKSAE